MKALIGFASGFVFALGLALARMTDPNQVLAFLDVAGAWDPALAFVMGGAIPVFAVAFHSSKRRARPVFAERFQHPTARFIDGRLLAGAVLFGVGWGVAGYCPGPALVSAASGSTEAILFSISMVSAFFVARRVLRGVPGSVASDRGLANEGSAGLAAAEGTPGDGGAALLGGSP